MSNICFFDTPLCIPRLEFGHESPSVTWSPPRRSGGEMIVTWGPDTDEEEDSAWP